LPNDVTAHLHNGLRHIGSQAMLVDIGYVCEWRLL